MSSFNALGVTLSYIHKSTNLIIGLCSLVGRNLAVPILALGLVPLRCLAGVSAITIASTSTSASTSTPTAATASLHRVAASAVTWWCIVLIVGRNLVCNSVPGLAGFRCPWLPPLVRSKTAASGHAVMRGHCLGPEKGSAQGVRARIFQLGDIEGEVPSTLLLAPLVRRDEVYV